MAGKTVLPSIFALSEVVAILEVAAVPLQPSTDSGRKVATAFNNGDRPATDRWLVRGGLRSVRGLLFQMPEDRRGWAARLPGDRLPKPRLQT